MRWKDIRRNHKCENFLSLCGRQHPGPGRMAWASGTWQTADSGNNRDLRRHRFSDCSRLHLVSPGCRPKSSVMTPDSRCSSTVGSIGHSPCTRWWGAHLHTQGPVLGLTSHYCARHHEPPKAPQSNFPFWPARVFFPAWYSPFSLQSPVSMPPKSTIRSWSSLACTGALILSHSFSASVHGFLLKGIVFSS